MVQCLITWEESWIMFHFLSKLLQLKIAKLETFLIYVNIKQTLEL